MKKLVYTGATDAQVRWGGNSDPRGVLIEGRVYTVEHTDVRSWHTKIKLVGIDGWFNSVCFEDAKGGHGAD
jgi:hypothetical protein